MAAVGDLHRGSVLIAVHSDHFDAEPLQFNRHFLPQFSRSEKQDLDRT